MGEWGEAMIEPLPRREGGGEQFVSAGGVRRGGGRESTLPWRVGWRSHWQDTAVAAEKKRVTGGKKDTAAAAAAVGTRPHARPHGMR